MLFMICRGAQQGIVGNEESFSKKYGFSWQHTIVLQHLCNFGTPTPVGGGYELGGGMGSHMWGIHGMVHSSSVMVEGRVLDESHSKGVVTPAIAFGTHSFRMKDMSAMR